MARKAVWSQIPIRQRTAERRLLASARDAKCEEAHGSRRRFELSRKDERSAVGDDDRVLDMRGDLTVSGLYGPPVAALTNLAAAVRNDRLDRDHQAIGELC